jgi:hypothetical protein
MAPSGFLIRPTPDGLDLWYRSTGVVQLIRPIIDQPEGSRERNIETAVRSVMGGMQDLINPVEDGVWPASPSTSRFPPSPEAEVKAGELYLWWADAAGKSVVALRPISLRNVGDE